MKLLRKNQGQISGGILVFLLGSWLSVFCQNCMAMSEQESAASVSGKHHHCMQDENDPALKVNTDSNEHCSGVCDCQQLDTIASVAQLPGSEKNNKDQHSFELVVFNTHQKLAGLRDSSTGFRQGDPPERASFLPLERYCVLLN